MENEDSAHSSFSLLSPLDKLWQFSSLSHNIRHSIFPPLDFEKLVQRNYSNLNHPLQVCPKMPGFIRVFSNSLQSSHLSGYSFSSLIIFLLPVFQQHSPPNSTTITNPFSKPFLFFITFFNRSLQHISFLL